MSLTGLVSYKYSETWKYTPKTDTGSGKYTSSMTLTASGEGAFGANGFAIVSGSITGKDSGAWTE